jgi:hypothetical protein
MKMPGKPPILVPVLPADPRFFFLFPSAQLVCCSDPSCRPEVRLHPTGNLPLPTLILTIILTLSPPLLSTLTSPVFPPPLPFPFNRLPGSRLCLLNGLSLSPPGTCSLRFLLLSLVKRESKVGARRSLTILLRFCLVCLGVAAEGAVGAAGRDAGGATLGRGDGAALGGREGGAGVPFAVLVRILSLGAGRGMGDAMAGGVATALGKAIGAGVGFAAGGAEMTGGTGRGTGVRAAGAGVAGFEGGATAFAGCMSGTSGVDERVSVLASTGSGAGEAFLDGSIGEGE